MAYSTSNQPICVVNPTGGNGVANWKYASTDAAATVDGAGYFTDAKKLGMKVGDMVEVYDTTNNIVTMHRVAAISAAGAADLGAGTTIGSATNAD